MTRAFRISAIWRWIFAGVGVVAAFFGTLYFSICVLLFGPFPKDLAGFAAGFLMGLLIVLAGSLLAPRNRLTTAIILCFLAALICAVILNSLFLGALAGGLVGVGFAASWFHPGQTARSTLWVSIATCASLLAFISLAYARYVDWPAHTKELPSELSQALGANAELVTAFYCYDFGGFIDREWLWRIDAKPERFGPATHERGGTTILAYAPSLLAAFNSGNGRGVPEQVILRRQPWPGRGALLLAT